MAPGVVKGILEYAALAVVLGVGCVAVPHVPRAWRALVRLGRHLRLIAPEPEPPSGRPLEHIADDIRRLQPEARSPRPGVTMARQRGIIAAYDDSLLAACRALGIQTNLDERVDGRADGLERGAERLRVEFELERAGLDFGPPRAA